MVAFILFPSQSYIKYNLHGTYNATVSHSSYTFPQGVYDTLDYYNICIASMERVFVSTVTQSGSSWLFPRSSKQNFDVKMVWNLTTEQCLKVFSLLVCIIRCFKAWAQFVSCSFLSASPPPPSNSRVLIWFYSYIGCFDILSNTCSVAENTFFAMLAFAI